MKNHEELFTALLNRQVLVNNFNGKTMQIGADGAVVLQSKNWHNFNPSEWDLLEINNIPEEEKGEKTISENKD